MDTPAASTILFWRRTDVAGLERLELARAADGIEATSTMVCTEDGGFRLDHHWRLDAGWRTQSVRVERWGAQGHGVLLLERAGTGSTAPRSRWPLRARATSGWRRTGCATNTCSNA